MKNLIAISLLSFVVFSCQPKQEDDVYLYLTQEQKAFITTVHAGDTAIWESDGGIKDTGIVEPIVYSRQYYDIKANPKVSIETASYNYRIIGTQKNYLFPSIRVQTEVNGKNSLDETALYGGYSTKGIIHSRVFGGAVYNNIFWTTFKNNTDTVFWNAKGILGNHEPGLIIEKIR